MLRSVWRICMWILGLKELRPIMRVVSVLASLPCSERLSLGTLTGLILPCPQKPTLPNSHTIQNAQTHFNRFLRTPKCIVGKQITSTIILLDDNALIPVFNTFVTTESNFPMIGDSKFCMYNSCF